MVSMLSCGFDWSNITRLLKTAENGAIVEIVASSSSEALAGVSL